MLIRQDKNVNKVEITTLGVMGYNLHEFKISDMVDAPINRNIYLASCANMQTDVFLREPQAREAGKSKNADELSSGNS